MLFHWIQSLADARRRAWLRRGCVALALVVVCVATGLGLARVSRHVHALPKYATPLTFHLTPMPDWAGGLGLEPVMLESLEPFHEATLLDANLVDEIARRLRENVWVRRVVRVEKKFGGVVDVECTYRRPIAAIGIAGETTWIDEDLVRLPARPDTGTGRPLLWVDGIRGPAPEIGRPWEGEDVAAAVRLAAILIDEPYANQIRALMFENFRGRINRREPHVKLVTTYDTRIIWGSAPGEEIEEPLATEKIARLRWLYRQFKRVDKNARWVNLTKGPGRIGFGQDLPDAISAAARRR